MKARITACLALLVIALPIAYAVHLGQTPGMRGLPTIPQEPALRKQVFLEYLTPVVRDQNDDILGDRALLLTLSKKQQLEWYDTLRWQNLAERYRVDIELDRDEVSAQLMRRIHPLPQGLVLAQAAKESGWGRSRFAREGNAIFGQRCFNRGCGITPKKRAANFSFEVESFDSVAASVESYLLNLNNHERYVDLRRERGRLINAGQEVTGTALAAFTGAYSERSDAYVQEIIDLIRRNKLDING